MNLYHSLVAARRSDNKAQKAAMALAKDDGVVRAQVQTTMSTLLIQVQDRVMTDLGVSCTALKLAVLIGTMVIKAVTTVVEDRMRLNRVHTRAFPYQKLPSRRFGVLIAIHS